MNERYNPVNGDSTHTGSVNKTFIGKQTGSEHDNYSKDNSFPYVVFGVPIALAIFITILKYIIGDFPDRREAGKIILDICVDTLTVGATILIAYHYMIENPGDIFLISVMFAIAMLLSISVRNLNLKGVISDKWPIVLCFFTCCVVIILLYFKVC